MRSGKSMSSGASDRRCARRRRPPTASQLTLTTCVSAWRGEGRAHYSSLLGRRPQLAVADRSLMNQRETLRLTEVRRDAGFGEEQDVASAGARVAAIEASVPPIRR